MMRKMIFELNKTSMRDPITLPVCTLLFFLALPHFSLCQEISIIDGVRHIRNTKIADKDKAHIQLNFVRKYGGIDADDEYFLYRPAAVAVDHKDNLYILDMDEPHVKVFDHNGKFLRSFGNKGSGPGEFMLPTSLTLDQNENLWILDVRRHYITVLTPKGDFLRESYIVTDKGWIPHFIVRDDGNLLGGTTSGLRWARRGDVYDDPIMKIVDQKSRLIRGFGEPRRYKDPTMAKTANAVYFALDKDENIWAAFLYQNRIEKYSSEGKFLIQMKRNLSYTITEEPKAKYQFNKKGGVQGVGLSTLNIVSTGLGIDYKGRIWVMTFSRQPRYQAEGFMRVEDGESDYVKLEIFDKDGILIDEKPLSEAFRPGQKAVYIKARRLFLLNGNDASVMEYEISDNQNGN